MNSALVDRLTRRVFSRATGHAAMGTIASLNLLQSVGSGEARRNRRKRCKGDTKRCGKRCCPSFQECVGGKCRFRTFGCTLVDNSCTGSEVACPERPNGSCVIIELEGLGHPACIASLSCDCESGADCAGAFEGCFSLVDSVPCCDPVAGLSRACLDFDVPPA